METMFNSQMSKLAHNYLGKEILHQYRIPNTNKKEFTSRMQNKNVKSTGTCNHRLEGL